MLKTLIKVILLFLLTISPFAIYSQKQQTYNLEFLKAKIVDSTNNKDILILFLVTAKDIKDFPPVLSMRIIFSINGGPEKKINILKDENKTTLVVYDENINVRNNIIYNLIKDKINIKSKDKFLILAFQIDDICIEKIKCMTFTYGLWEKLNSNIRIETKYEFNVE